LFGGVWIIFQPHPRNSHSIGEPRIIKQMVGSWVDDEFHVGTIARLRLRQSLAIRRRSDIVQFADEDESRDLQLDVRLIFARGVEGRRDFEFHIVRDFECGDEAGRGDLERGVGALRITDSGNPFWVDERKPGKVKQGPESVGYAFAEVFGAGFLDAASGEIIDEERDIAPARKLAGNRTSGRREAEARVQQDDGWKRTTSIGLGQVALNRRAGLAFGDFGAMASKMLLNLMEAGSGAVEFHQFLG